jgi:hypothetical protein
MNLRQHIKQIIREESSEDIKTPYLKYDKLISGLVDDVFGDNICGFNWEVFKLHHREGIQIRIILYVMPSHWDMGYETYGIKKRELHNLINDFFPKFNGIFITTDTMKCGEKLNESEITERCWKGYTQKGMKTMFGKRYPNCVKIKKKKESKEGAGGYDAPPFEMEPDHVHFKHISEVKDVMNKSIRRIVREEVQKKYENIRRMLKEEINTVDVKTIESELTNILGSSNIKNGNRVEFVKIGPFKSSFDIVVDRLDQNTLNYLNKFMYERGWFPTNISLSGMKGRIYSNHVNEYLGEDDVQIGYESNFGKQVNTNPTKAFHVTPDIFIDGIKKTGLTLKSESKLSNHPDRIYLFLNENKDTPKSMVWAIWNSLSKERQNQIKDYYLLEIDLTKLPNHKFYLDPQSMATYGAIYTNQSIPRSAIKVIDKISTSDIETKDDEVVMSKEEERRARDEKRRKEEEELRQKKEFDASLSKQIERSKEIDKLPDHIKYMDIDDLFNS